uniref:Putative ribonuclease H-like domain-containing protein n=1 Tax=Tanacetum cinerariifolium TaxID=118510 RepID=A0A6L2KFE0_TANCI|nr:putative ribonuclease H-like domain-containing protein [Tanacetum cinerariifolium]
MKMEHYLSHTDYLIWQVIQNGNGPVSVTTDTNGTTASSSSNTQNVAFMFADNTSSTNDVSTAYSVSSPSVSKLQKEGSPSYNDEVIHSFFANQSSSDNEVQSCSKTCAESYARLKKLYDEQRDKLGDASVEITAYTLALKKVEAHLLCHQQNQLAYEQKIKLMKIELDDKTDVLTYHKKLLAEALKEKEDLKTKVENWQNSSKNLNRLLNTQMRVNDKFRLGYGDYRYGSILSYENEVLQRNYMPSGPDVEIDYSKFTYATSMFAPVDNAPKIVCEPKVWTDAPIIEEYESDSDDDSVHMTGNKAHLADYQEFKGGSVAFGGSNGKITGKGKIKVGMLDFKDVYYVEELKHYNLFFVSQICDKKNKVLFTDTDCLVLSPDFKLLDENQASIDESNKWNRRLGHVNFKNLNKLVKGNLIRGLPSKIFENDHTCVACQNEKQHKASCKAKTGISDQAFYELLTGRKPIISYLRPFGCHVTILNTIDQLGKFDGKFDLGYLVGYSLNSKAFRKGHVWMFDHDYLTNSMNYEPVSLENQANKFASPQEANNSAGTNDDLCRNSEESDLHDENFVQHIWSAYSTIVKSSKDKIQKTIDCKTCEKLVSQVEQIFQEELENLKRQEKKANDAVWKEATYENQDVNTNSTNLLNAVSTPVSVVGPLRALNDDEPSYPDDTLMPHLEDIYASPSAGIFTDSSYDDEAVQTRSKVYKNSKAHAVVWILVDLPFGKKAIGTKWVYRNKKDKRGVVVRNKARLVVQGHRQEEGIDYDEAFAPVARIEAIRIFLAFASYIGFIVYQMDVKSAFMYDTLDEEVYVTQPHGFVDPKFPNKVYKVVKALYGLHQAPIGWLSRRKMTQKPLVKDEEAADVDVYLYRPMIGSLMYLTAFRYLKGQPKLGLWYPKVSSFDLEAYLDNDYAGTIVATSTTEAEYVDAAHYCG